MHICVTCKSEMVCTYTGKSAVFGEGHVYPGDEFTCKECGATVLNCPSAPYHSDKVDKWNPECYIRINAK